MTTPQWIFNIAQSTLPIQRFSFYTAKLTIHQGPLNTFQMSRHSAALALLITGLQGRSGRGNIYVWATGNGGFKEDDCNADGYASSIYTLSVGSITDKGRRPYFTENCTSTLAVVPSGGEEVRGEETKLNVTKLKVVGVLAAMLFKKVAHLELALSLLKSFFLGDEFFEAVNREEVYL